MKKTTRAALRGAMREIQQSHGFYDGRFATKVVGDKKKAESKNKCKNFKY